MQPIIFVFACLPLAVISRRVQIKPTSEVSAGSRHALRTLLFAPAALRLPSRHASQVYPRVRNAGVNALNHLGRHAAVMGAESPSDSRVEQLRAKRLAGGPALPIVSPSVAKADMLKLGEDLKAAVEGGAEWLHFSVQDGRFVPKMGVGSPVVAAAREAFPSTIIDVKLGCMDPENRVAEFAKAGADVISFHPESTLQPAALVQAITKAGCAPGLVVNPGTAISTIEPLIDQVEVIVIMLVSPGWGGPKYLDGAVRKIQEIGALCKERGIPTPYIEVDGGVSTKNAAELIDAGANVLVAGGSVFSADDKRDAIDTLRNAGK